MVRQEAAAKRRADKQAKDDLKLQEDGQQADKDALKDVTAEGNQNIQASEQGKGTKRSRKALDNTQPASKRSRNKKENSDPEAAL